MGMLIWLCVFVEIQNHDGMDDSALREWHFVWRSGSQSDGIAFASNRSQLEGGAQ